jgi:hypothetical protein
MRLKLNEFRIKQVKINQKKQTSENSVFLCLTENDVFNLALTSFILTDIGDCFLLERKPLHEDYGSSIYRVSKDFKMTTKFCNSREDAILSPLEEEELYIIKRNKQLFRPSNKEVIVTTASEYQPRGNVSFFVQTETGEHFLISR